MLLTALALKSKVKKSKEKESRTKQILYVYNRRLTGAKCYVQIETTWTHSYFFRMDIHYSASIPIHLLY